MKSGPVAALLGPQCTPRAVEEQIKKLRKNAKESGFKALAGPFSSPVKGSSAKTKRFGSVDMDGNEDQECPSGDGDGSPRPKRRKVTPSEHIPSKMITGTGDEQAKERLVTKSTPAVFDDRPDISKKDEEGEGSEDLQITRVVSIIKTAEGDRRVNS